MNPVAYKFHASIDEFPDDSWREFEVLSNGTLTQLAASVMAAFQIKPRHSWYLHDGERQFEHVIPYTDKQWKGRCLIKPTDPAFILLEDLKFPRTKKTLRMRYNYTLRWDFTIEYLGKRTLGPLENSYSQPLFIDGRGGSYMEGVDAAYAREIMLRQKAGDDTSKDLKLAFFVSHRDTGWKYDQFDIAQVRDEFRDNCLRNEFAYRGFKPDVWYGYACPEAH